MINGIIAKKLAMSHAYASDGKIIPVTVLEVVPCVVTQLKSKEKDGYDACQIGFGNIKPKLLKKPQAGQLKNITQKPKIIREFGIVDKEQLSLGKKIVVSDIFSVGDKVQVTSVSKGKGFQGGVKRWNFRGGPKTHGQSDRQRAPGSIGSTTTPGRVYKGKKMAGHMGNDNVTVKGLKVIELDLENQRVKISGAIPGHRNSTVILKKQTR